MSNLPQRILSTAFSLMIVIGLSAQTLGEFKVIAIPSPSLKNAIIGGREQQEIGIYLPPSYNTSSKKYPVVYFLTGFTVHAGQYPPTPWIDSIMSRKLVQEMIFVEIAGFNLFQGSMYANSPVTDNWDDFITKDVIAYIDNNYRTLAKRESRGLAGHSMGGGGCFNVSLKHADLFSVAYPMSPAIAAYDSLMKDMFSNIRIVKAIEKLSAKMAMVTAEKFAEKLAIEKLAFADSLDWILGYGSAFAPDLTQPLKIAMPVQLSKEGKIIRSDKNWKLWEEGFGSIDIKVKTHQSDLMKYRFYGFDCGYRDIPWIYTGTNFLAQQMTNYKIPFSLQIYDGDHTNKVSEQLANRVMPIMSAYLAKE